MPKGTQGIVASPDGKQVLAMDLASPRIAVIDAATDSIVDEITLSNSTKGAWGAKYSLDGSMLVVVSVNDRTATLLSTADWRSPQTVLKVGSAPFGIAFTADKKSVFVVQPRRRFDFRHRLEQQASREYVRGGEGHRDAVVLLGPAIPLVAGEVLGVVFA